MMQLKDFDYELPPELIAYYPTEQRTQSRLLVVDPVLEKHTDSVFSALVEQLQPEDLLVFNDTKVQKARLLGHKETGGAVEVLIERLWDDFTATAMIKASKALKVGAQLWIDRRFKLVVEQVEKSLYKVSSEQVPLQDIMRNCGQVPLPPYIKRKIADGDEERYQTVYARELGSAAAPTAGLHFDDQLLAQLQAAGIRRAFITLHVGLGTFQPVRSETVDKHKMHAEVFSIDEKVCTAVNQARKQGGRVIAVGTTSLRALETAAQAGALTPMTGESTLFVVPGFKFNVVDALITNFHLPRSTLLMLVSAFAGRERMLSIYRWAVAQKYRFFSFGDAMFIVRKALGDQINAI